VYLDTSQLVNRNQPVGLSSSVSHLCSEKVPIRISPGAVTILRIFVVSVRFLRLMPEQWKEKGTDSVPSSCIIHSLRHSEAIYILYFIMLTAQSNRSEIYRNLNSNYINARIPSDEQGITPYEHRNCEIESKLGHTIPFSLFVTDSRAADFHKPPTSVCPL
jgi:hypothetical protein